MFCSMMPYDGSFLGFKFEPKLRFPDKCRPSLFVLYLFNLFAKSTATWFES